MRRRWYPLIIALAVLASLFIAAYRIPFCDSGGPNIRLEYHELILGLPSSSTLDKRGIKTILYWNGLFKAKDFMLGEGYIAKHCPSDYNNCFATKNRHLLPIESYDAILLHGNSGELMVDDLPVKRSPHQKYVFVAAESPGNWPFNSSGNDDVWPRFKGYFNATATYQHDSDVIYTYADVIALKDEKAGEKADDGVKRLDTLSIKEILAKKSRKASWYVSHCKTNGHREKYVTELEKYMPVDKFGRCHEWLVGCPVRDRDCFHDEIEPNYFFYLSFENSLCQDYVTEKFFDALKYYVVPVVYGGADYAKIAPPKSYIDALDFDSPKDLASYLINLSRNLTKYEEYFEWKEHYKIIDPQKRVICELCKLVNNNEKKTYTVSEWYNSSRCPLQHRMSRQVYPDFAVKRTKSIP
ncbi:hypothetical protein QAD02_015951 [Eretmocerus hayati]|uniref:Uncharacterized protein n=1 Tax=Eretmocerus hayati TaxID=131215 RepID=A0ACC2PC42_9HYME|nr:hypothetical protein QAD02_015951 [Eretmocerus hayati]